MPPRRLYRKYREFPRSLVRNHQLWRIQESIFALKCNPYPFVYVFFFLFLLKKIWRPSQWTQFQSSSSSCPNTALPLHAQRKKRKQRNYKDPIWIHGKKKERRRANGEMKWQLKEKQRLCCDLILRQFEEWWCLVSPKSFERYQNHQDQKFEYARNMKLLIGSCRWECNTLHSLC